MKFTPDEIQKLKSYMATKFGQPSIDLRVRAKAEDSLEVTLKGEFIGTMYKDVEDGETSYTFNMAILDIDLEDAE